MKSGVRKVHLGIAAAIAVALIAVLAVALLGGSSGGQEPKPSENTVVLSEPELLLRADGLEHKAFWIGFQADTPWYVLSSTPDGDVSVRYLAEVGDAGDPHADSVVVTTHRVPDARRAIRQRAKAAESGAVSIGRGFDILAERRSNRAYVVYYDLPESLVEVSSPVPGEARALAAAGEARELN